VLAAGNDDHDVVEYEDVPTTIASKNDNLMIVGAVDAEGEWSSFTNFNEDLVRVFDHGVNAVSFTPTGRLAPISGTSQAAPNAAGAVAKLFALFPDMTPQEARAIIEESGDPIPAPYYGVIVNEEKAVALAKERHGG
jgi:subtilisin family serine protease